MKKSIFGKLVFMLLLVSLIWAPDVFAEMKISASDGTKGDGFGESVAIDGNIAVVGTSYFTDAAYIFELGANGAWSQSAKLLPSEINPGEYFGNSVAVSGDYILVCSRYDVHDHGSGSVYVFKRNTAGNWMQTAKIRPEVGHDNEIFAWSVSLSGKMAVISALVSTPDANSSRFSGVAYVFERNSDETWTQQARLLAPDGYDNDYFGASVSIYGKYIAVGAYLGKNKGLISGAAYIYKQNVDNTWRQVTKLYPSDYRLGASFGISVFLSEDNLIVGAYRDSENEPAAGAAYIFKRKAESEWQEMTKLTAGDGDEGDLFGRSVALHGNLAVIGASGEYGNYNFGAAYLFKRDTSGKWLQENKVSAFDRFNDQYFGESVAISNTHVLVGAPGRWSTLNGSAYIYPVEVYVPGLIRTLPPPPDSVTASDGKYPDKICINWSVSHRAEAYEIYRAEKPASRGGVLQKIRTTTASSCYDTTADPGITYYYWVRMKNAFGTSKYSLFDTGYYGQIKQPPPAPTGVNASGGIYKDKVNISWNLSSEATSYDIFRAQTPVFLGGVMEKIGSTSATFFNDIADPCDTPYYYWVRAKNEIGKSKFSIFDMGYCFNLKSTPVAPTNVSASGGEFSSEIRITWSASPGAVAYDIYRSDRPMSKGGIARKIITTSATSFDDTSVTCGIPYYYWIKAKNLNGVSRFSRFETGNIVCQATIATNTPSVFALPEDVLNSIVSLSGNMLALGSKNSVLIYERDGDGNWMETELIEHSDHDSDDPFGRSVSLSGRTLLIGAPYDDDNGQGSGSVYFYEQNQNGLWVPKAKLLASDGQPWDRFGKAIYMTGDIALISAYNETNRSNSNIYIFERDINGKWAETWKIPSDGYERYFGKSFALSGARLIIGAPGREPGYWDIETLTGSAYIFKRNPDGTWAESAKLTPLESEEGGGFGEDVSLSGNMALIGAPFDGAGSAFVFKQNVQGHWTQTAKLLPSDRFVSRIDFGTETALSEKYIFVGYVDRYLSFNQGVDIYDRNLKQINEPEFKLRIIGSEYNSLGNSINISGDILLVGAQKVTWVDIEYTPDPGFGGDYYDDYTVISDRALYEYTLTPSATHLFSNPPAPTEVIASDSSYADKVRISWEASSDATSYEIYRASEPVYHGGIMEKIGTTEDVCFYDESAVCDVTYYYWVRVKNAFGLSKFSKFDIGTAACW